MNGTLEKILQKQDERMEALAKGLSDVQNTLARTPMHGTPNKSDVLGLPNVRMGENIMGSRGFSFAKMIGSLSGAFDNPREQCKQEMDVADRMHRCLVKEAGPQGYQYKGGTTGGRFLAPLGTGFLPDQFVPRDFRVEMKQMVHAGVDGADVGEAAWIRRKVLSGMGYDAKALSWLNELSGGALVAPPEMGELIELLRNKEALVNAGARVVPLPPQGRLVYPRQTAASTTYWVGESFPITESTIGTGEVTLQAKKLAVLIKAPNELIRFASPAAEALLRDDMTKSLALGLDLAGLEGNGGDTRPLGLINQIGINTVNSSVQGANGDQVVPEDVYRMIAAVEESNAEFECFVMRPKTLYKYYQLRADAVSQGDKRGAFVFNMIREAQDDTPATLAGYPVVKSTQVSGVQTKGTGTNLTYVVGGMFSDMLIGMFGAIEFAATALGDTAFLNDQTWVRGILSADIQLRHAGAFSYMPNLGTTL